MAADRFHGDDARPHDYFTGCAGDYLATRPRYPSAALAAVLDGLPPRPRVADVGSGPGIAARGLAALGARVVAVEPNPDMLARAASVPAPSEGDGGDPRGRVHLVRACAEATALRDGAVQAVTCAQSYHWCDPGRALPEFHRILAPGGRLALLWNLRGSADGPRPRYGALMDRARAAAVASGRAVPRDRGVPSVGGWFTNVRTLRFPNPTSYDLERLLGRAASTSFFPAGGPLREELLREVEELFAEFSENGRLVLETVCEVMLADRADR